ncbi:MAG: type II toxin-antitoxin system VapC family toxin [Gemmatimonadaceae bacterium]|nr:type II toxin-antitoxin system VapC family toxin [Gemmatimonadaceae bacterium]
MTKAKLNVVDSSAWLAYFADEPGAHAFAGAIEDTAGLVVPTICLTEVFKVVARQRGEGDALQAIAVMQQGRVVNLDGELALAAAVVGTEHKLPLADSIVYATARQLDAVVWTQDEDFKGLPNARYFRKRRT